MAEDRVHRFAVIAALNNDWTRLCEISDAAVESWAQRHRSLQACRTLPDVLRTIPNDPDAALASLLTDAKDRDALAGRAVLQAMLGKIVRLAQTYSGIGVDDFVSAMWCRIQTYPLARRPSKIAANLALDCRKDALTAASLCRLEHAAGSLAEPGWEALLAGPDVRTFSDHAEETSRTARQVLDLACDAGILDESMSSVLRTVYLEGLNSRSAARHHGTTAAMVRYRCSVALRRLSQHADLFRTTA